jgi:hypothetical protein
MIETLPKGALPDPQDDRDYRVGLMGIAPVYWSREFRLPEPPDSEQYQADCCVGESWSYYHWQLKTKKFGVKSVFAYIAQPYGAYIRDGGLRIVNFGQETFEEAPDPNPKTPQNMRDKTGLNPPDALDDSELDSFVLPDGSIDGVAWGIKNYKGVVFGVTGTNEGWRDILNPRPPQAGETTWGHALYAMGYHMHDGLKCIIAKSSWCNSGVKEHHIKENYFVSGNTFNGWTLIPRKESMKLVNDNGTFYIEGELGKLGIADLGTLEKFQKVTGQVETRASVGPQVGVFKTQSVLVDN